MSSYQKLTDQLLFRHNLAGVTEEDVASTMVVNSGWLFQPLQGRVAATVASGTAAAFVVAPYVDFFVQIGADITALGSLQAVLSISTQGIQGEDESYSVTLDVSGQMLENHGHIRVDAGNMPLSQYELTISNWGVESGVVRVAMSTFGLFLPIPAPAEVQDSYGFGRGGLVPRPDVGSPARLVRPDLVETPTGAGFANMQEMHDDPAEPEDIV